MNRGRTILAVAIIAVVAIAGALLFRLPDLALQIAPLVGGFLFGFIVHTLFPGRERTFFVLVACVFVAAVCFSFLGAMGRLSSWEVAGTSAWALLIRFVLWFGLGVFYSSTHRRRPAG